METAASIVLRAIGGDSLKYRYNEAVVDGFLPCAPDATQGVHRMFDVDDAIGAEIFGYLIGLGFSARRAGTLTCVAVDLKRSHKGPIIKIILTNEGGKPKAIAVSSYKQQIDSVAPVLIEFNLVTIMEKLNTILNGVVEAD